MKIAICGSMAFSKKMLEAKLELDKREHTVYLPANIEAYLDGSVTKENKEEKIKLDVLRNYYNIIKESDGVLVVNETKGDIENYIGGNSLIEMAFAHVLGKKVYLLNQVPFMSYYDEIVATYPIVISRDYDLIKNQ